MKGTIAKLTKDDVETRSPVLQEVLHRLERCAKADLEEALCKWGRHSRKAIIDAVVGYAGPHSPTVNDQYMRLMSTLNNLADAGIRSSIWLRSPGSAGTLRLVSYRPSRKIIENLVRSLDKDFTNLGRGGPAAIALVGGT